MKRLKHKFLNMDLNTATYNEMYEGSMTVIDPEREWAPPVRESDPTYYKGEIGFKITATHKLAQDKPTVTVIIPADYILDYKRRCDTVVRSKRYLREMEESTSTYKEMYDGKVLCVVPSTSWNGHAPDPEIIYDTTYWHEDGVSSFKIEETNKLSKDKPTVTWQIPCEKIGISEISDTCADFCLRKFKKYIDELNRELYNRSRPDNENGKYYIHEPNGKVTRGNTAYFAMCPQKDYENGGGSMVYMLTDNVARPPKMCLCIRMQVQLPKKRLKKAMTMLCKDLPDAVDRFISEFDYCGLYKVIELAERQQKIRAYLKNSEYCAFIANGSVLPRRKGTDLPLENAIPFKSTAEDEIEICGIRGMGIKKGVTVITGGGYSGKSTLLDAISAGIYNHVLGDGRELCITDENAVTVSAEDGRSISHLNISPFIKWLPNGNTSDFSTHHASGSTSQAANIMEAIDTGSTLLLIDEDRSATNFMIRDKMMKELISKEPITPFTDRARELYKSLGVSTILVIGGSGEYLSVADRVYLMEDYVISDVSEKARNICTKNGINAENPPICVWNQKRKLLSKGFSSYPEGGTSERLEVSDMGFMFIGDEAVDVRGINDIASKAQLDALGFMIRYLMVSNNEPHLDLKKRVDELYDLIEREGLDTVYSSFFTTARRFLQLPRKSELYSVISRMRNLHFEI
ncbi:MAG: ABC-ATPase domain-containing protein [Clostridia bacterium]|nr:ABC-ATPase domain-containing protein [Clostridia bacterium]